MDLLLSYPVYPLIFFIMCMFMCTTYACKCPCRPQEGVGDPSTYMLCECQEPNSGPLKEQGVVFSHPEPLILFSSYCMLGEHTYLMWRSQHSFQESVFSFMWVPGIEFKLAASVVQIHLSSLLPVSLTLNIYCLVCVCMSGGVCSGQRTYFGSEFSLPC